jgi:hypothetical protein
LPAELSSLVGRGPEIAAVLECLRATPVTAAAGFPTRGEIVRRYAEITGFDVADITWYRAFAYFKLAVICQGVAARAAGGAMLGSGFEEAQAIVEPLVRAGHHVLAGPGAVTRPLSGPLFRRLR